MGGQAWLICVVFMLCSCVVQRLEENKRVLLLEGPSVSVSLSSSLIVGAQTAVRRLCVEYKVSRGSGWMVWMPSKHVAHVNPRTSVVTDGRAMSLCRVQGSPNTAHPCTPCMPLIPSKHAPL